MESFQYSFWICRMCATTKLWDHDIKNVKCFWNVCSPSQKKSCVSCRFTYTVDWNLGLYLQSVNGLPGANENQTYWELLVKNINGTTRLSVGELTERLTLKEKSASPNVKLCFFLILFLGIGCFPPKPNDEVILNYTTYPSHSHEDL